MYNTLFLSYQSVVGLFGKNGVGKTRALNAVHNTIKSAIEKNDSEFLDGITEDAKSKVLFLDANTIIEIKNQQTNLFQDEGFIPFDEHIISEQGMQKYLINYGKSLLMYMGLQWYELETLSEQTPARIFSEMFKQVFEVEFRAVFDPKNYRLNLQVDSLDIEVYELSDGEWITVFYLLLATLVKCTNGRFSDAIVIIDELENYLNPANMKWILNFLCDAFENRGQIWIASHSLDVLLLIDSKRVYRLEKTKNSQHKKTVIYKPNINNFEKIRRELCGNEEDAITGFSFREEETHYYFSEFMSQSLEEPTTVKCISENDIQLRLFLECLDAKNEKIKILDFGAGEGRIGDALQRIKDDRIQYYAYEIDKDKAHAIAEKQYAKKVYILREEIDESFDIVLLCNVLHEIDALEWTTELNFIFSSLSEKGILVFIEDLELPVGEYIGEKGFLLLDGEMAKTLFGKENVSLILSKEEKYRERILCAAVDKKSVVTTENVISALELMKKRNIEKIWQIRRNKKNKFFMQRNRLGVLMARASQLVVNSSIAIEYIKSVQKDFIEPLEAFVSCFIGSIGKMDAEKGINMERLESALAEVLDEFADERDKAWVLQKNVALAGSLIQRLNHILAKANLKIYNCNFTKLIDEYIHLNVSDLIMEDECKNLLKHLIFLDLNNKGKE